MKQNLDLFFFFFLFYFMLGVWLLLFIRLDMYWNDFLKTTTVYSEGPLLELLKVEGICTNTELVEKLNLPPVLPYVQNTLMIPKCLSALIYQYLAKSRGVSVKKKKRLVGEDTTKNTGRFFVDTEVLQYHRLFEYGYQPKKDMFYLRYYNMLTLDYDGLTLSEIVADTKRLANRFGVSFHLYTTSRGIHAFLTSKVIMFFSELAEQVYAASRADPIYFEYCLRSGYIIRLSRKAGEPKAPAPVRRFLRVVGSCSDHPTMTFILNRILDYTDLVNPRKELPGLLTVADDPSAYGAFVRGVTNRAPTALFYPTQIVQYRRYLEARLGPTWETVRLLAPYFRTIARKPQLLIEEGTNEFVAMDITSKTVYMNLQDILMVDVDNSNSPTPGVYVQDLHEKCKSLGVSAAVFKTTRGYHLFLVDRTRVYHCQGSVKLALELGCDLYYSVYSYIRGWCVRLSPKKSERSDQPLYTYLGVVGQCPQKDLENRVWRHYQLSLDRVRLLDLLYKRYVLPTATKKVLLT